MKLKNRIMFLDEPSEGGGGSGGAIETLGPIDAGVTEVPESQGSQGTQTEAAPVTPTSNVDAKALAQEFGSALREHLSATKPGETEKPLTPEEAKKLLQVFEFDDTFLKDFANVETQKSAFERLRDGLIRQSDVLIQARLNEEIRRLRASYDPVVQSFERAQGEARETRFNTTYPSIGTPALKPIVAAVAQSLRDQGKTYNDEKSMFDDIAKGVEAVIQQSNPAFKLPTAPAAGATKTQAPASAIPVTTPGSGGGGGSSPAGNDKGPKALGILGKVKL